MKTLLEKTLSLLIAISILIFVPSTVTFAASDVCEIIGADGTTVTSYDDFADALAAVQDGETIKLLQNISYNAGIIVIGKSITINVNNYTLTATNPSGHGLEVGAGGEVWLDRSAGGAFNVKAEGPGAKHGVYAHNGGKAEVTDASSAANSADARGAFATGEDSVITVYGKIPFLSFYGLGASDGATVTVYGNVNGGGGTIASGAGTYVEIYGNSGGGGTGVIAFDGAEVYVHGNVIGGGAGVYLTNGSRVTVDGYIKALTGDHHYVQFYAPYKIVKMQGDFEPTSSKASYFEYTDGVSYVWVKYFEPPLPVAVTYIYLDSTEYSNQNAENTSADTLGSGFYESTLATAPNPIPFRKGYTFGGWFTAPDGGGIEWVFGGIGEGTELIIANGVESSSLTLILYAAWETVVTPDTSSPSTVTVNNSHAAAGNSGGGQYESGTIVTIRAGTKTGYTFIGWTVNLGGAVLADFNDATTTFTMPDNDVVVTANWAAVVVAPTKTVTATVSVIPPAVTSTQTIFATTTVTATTTTTSIITAPVTSTVMSTTTVATTATSTTTATATATVTAPATSTITSATTETNTVTTTVTSNTTYPPGQNDGDGKWALLNLILAAAGVLSAAVAIPYYTKPSERDESKSNQNTLSAEYASVYIKRNFVWLLIAIAAAITGIIFFFGTENMGNPMAFVDRWTLISANIFFICVVAACLSKVRVKAAMKYQGN